MSDLTEHIEIVHRVRKDVNRIKRENAVLRTRLEAAEEVLRHIRDKCELCGGIGVEKVSDHGVPWYEEPCNQCQRARAYFAAAEPGEGDATDTAEKQDD